MSTVALVKHPKKSLVDPYGGVRVTKLSQLSDVDTTNQSDGAVLFFNALTAKYEFTIIAGLTVINGGTF